MKNVEKELLDAEKKGFRVKSRAWGQGSKLGKGESKRIKRGKRKKKGKLNSILVEVRVILAILFVVGGIDAKLHPDNQNHVLRKLILAFFHLMAVLFGKVFKLDKETAEAWSVIIGIGIAYNLVLFILGGGEELKKDWGYFFSKKIREEVKKEAGKDRGALVFQIGTSLTLIFFSLVFPLIFFVVALITHGLGF